MYAHKCVDNSSDSACVNPDVGLCRKNMIQYPFEIRYFIFPPYFRGHVGLYRKIVSLYPAFYKKVGLAEKFTRIDPQVGKTGDFFWNNWVLVGTGELFFYIDPRAGKE